LIKVNEGVSRPDSLPQFVAANQLTRLFQQDLQNLKGLVLELDLDTLLAQLCSLEVHFERHKADWCSRRLSAFYQVSPRVAG
jgi:ribosomal protein S15P/S13E